jgi:hypothetical protein
LGSAKWSPQAAQWSEIDVQILVRQAKRRLQLPHAMVQLEERQSDSLDLLVAQRPAVHPPNRLVFQDLAKQFYNRQYKSRKTLLDVLRIGIDPVWKRSSDRMQCRRGGIFSRLA